MEVRIFKPNRGSNFCFLPSSNGCTNKVFICGTLFCCCCFRLYGDLMNLEYIQTSIPTARDAHCPVQFTFKSGELKMRLALSAVILLFFTSLSIYMAVLLVNEEDETTIDDLLPEDSTALFFNFLQVRKSIVVTLFILIFVSIFPRI